MKKLAFTLLIAALGYTTAFVPGSTVSILPSSSSLLSSTSRRNCNLLRLFTEDQTSSSSNKSDSESNNNSSSNLNGTTTTTTQEVMKEIGIGGDGGLVYDVNHLKRNLVQEIVKEYKDELWDLLGTPRSCHDEIETKLAALVQANPVSTTTDSNLLDGTWCHAFSSSQPAEVLLDTDRFVLKKGAFLKEPPKSKKKLGYAGQNPFRSSFREFQLEEEDTDPHMMDQVRFLGGLVTKKRKYNVMGLTRTELDLDLAERELYVFGKKLWNREYPPSTRDPLNIKVLYLDPDFCVSSSDGPFSVYTKNDEWMLQSARVKRNIRFGLQTLAEVRERVWSIVMARKKLWKFLSRGRYNNTADNKQDAILMEREVNGESKIRVLKLGDLGDDDEAWEGEMDPFVHLSADERQEYIKKLSFKQIDRAKRSQERRQKRQKKRRPVFQRIRPFKKPDETS